MSEAGFKDHFSSNSANYAANRPSYPAELAAFLAGEALPERELALDCGCGNGQLSVLLAEHFDRVVATDASAQQIAAASQHPRVTYRVACADASGLEPQSADLITVAQAAHWFDLDAFYAEVRRVAKPGALLALIAYGPFIAEADIRAATQDFYANVLGRYWPPERKLVEDGYRSLPFPFKEIAVPEMAIERQWTRDQLLAYVETWSAVRAMERAVGRGPFEDFANALGAIWPDDGTRAFPWPLAIRAARVT